VKNKISTHDKFNRDIIKYGGYKYSQKKLSTIIALSIETKFILKNLIDFQDLNFIDFGCGDADYQCHCDDDNDSDADCDDG
jgi:hypothetical protein